MALEKGTEVAVSLGNEYVEGTVVSLATNLQGELLVKVDSDQLMSSPQWFSGADIYEIRK